MRNLEGAGNAELGDRTRQMRGNVVAKKGHAASLRPEVSRRYVEKRRLAGAVRSDDGKILTFINVKVYTVRRDNPAEPDLDAFGREQDVGHQ